MSWNTTHCRGIRYLFLRVRWFRWSRGSPQKRNPLEPAFIQGNFWLKFNLQEWLRSRRTLKWNFSSLPARLLTPSHPLYRPSCWTTRRRLQVSQICLRLGFETISILRPDGRIAFYIKRHRGTGFYDFSTEFTAVWICAFIGSFNPFNRPILSLFFFFSPRATPIFYTVSTRGNSKLFNRCNYM